MLGNQRATNGSRRNKGSWPNKRRGRNLFDFARSNSNSYPQWKNPTKTSQRALYPTSRAWKISQEVRRIAENTRETARTLLLNYSHLTSVLIAMHHFLGNPWATSELTTKSSTSKK